jgi:hypothetical protein
MQSQNMTKSTGILVHFHANVTCYRPTYHFHCANIFKTWLAYWINIMFLLTVHVSHKQTFSHRNVTGKYL